MRDPADDIYRYEGPEPPDEPDVLHIMELGDIAAEHNVDTMTLVRENREVYLDVDVAEGGNGHGLRVRLPVGYYGHVIVPHLLRELIREAERMEPNAGTAVAASTAESCVRFLIDCAVKTEDPVEEPF